MQFLSQHNSSPREKHWSEEIMAAFDLGQLNPVKNFDIGWGTLGNVLAIILIVVVVLGLIGTLVFLWFNKRKWKIRIPLYKKIGNIPTRIAILKAKVVPIGRAGDVLWFAKGGGIKKWLPPAELQSAANEYPHFIREDGEWMNWVLGDIDEVLKRANVKYIKTDMRLQRLATDKILEQRHLNKSFWDKWGTTIMTAIFFLVIVIALVVFFSQFSKIVDKIGTLMDKANQIIDKQIKQEGGSAVLTPALISLIFSFRKNKREQGS